MVPAPHRAAEQMEGVVGAGADRRAHRRCRPRAGRGRSTHRLLVPPIPARPGRVRRAGVGERRRCIRPPGRRARHRPGRDPAPRRRGRTRGLVLRDRLRRGRRRAHPGERAHRYDDQPVQDAGGAAPGPTRPHRGGRELQPRRPIPPARRGPPPSARSLRAGRATSRSEPRRGGGGVGRPHTGASRASRTTG